MNLIKLFGVTALVLGLAACGGEADKAAEAAPEAAQETAAEAVEATEAEKVKSKFATEKFAEGASDDVSTAPAPAFKISENLKPGEYINSQGEVVKNRDVDTAKENPLLNTVPEGIEPGSVEHTMWLLEQEE